MSRLHGNSDVVDLAKSVLEIAEKGQLTYLAVSSINQVEDKALFAHAGSYDGIPGTLIGLDILKGELQEIDRRRRSGPTAPNTNANYHEFNLATDPISFDFSHWLIDAEMIRRRMGAPAPLRVGFRHKEELTERGERWLNNVFRPMLPMMGAVESDAALCGWRKALFVPTEIVAACKRGEEVPRFRPDPEATKQVQNWLAGRNPITITLREASHWEHRNSNLEAWVKFANDMKSKDEDIVFIRDTAKGNEPIDGFHCYPQASFNLSVRLALCELSKINLFISNGPGCFGIWGTKPYLYFVPLEKHDTYYGNDPDFWPQAHGIGQGDQWPWALPGQKMIWLSDSYENISAAWEARGD